jgi:predicted O-linked N-acetylglucosamine transferase (SPINDLY family)
MPSAEDQQQLQAAFSLHQAGRLDKAAELYRQIVSRDPDNSHALHYLGLIEASAGNYQQAKELLHRSLSVEPQNLQIAENYATILFQMEIYKSALEVSRHGLQLGQASVTLLYISAISLFKLKRFQESVAQFDKLLLLAPNNIAAINERGSALAQMKNYDAALVSFENALAFQPHYAEANLNKGNALGALKRYDEALAAYDRTLALKPALAAAWVGRGNVLVELNRYEDASRAYDQALALTPALADAWVGRGNVHIELGQHDNASTAFDRALALDPDLVEAWLGRAAVSCRSRHYYQALAAYDKALALKADFAEACLGRGSVFYALGQYNQALLACDQALALKPDFSEAWVGRGNILKMINRVNDALESYDRALKLKPKFAAAWLGRGQALVDMNRLAEAFAAYDRALSINPNSSAIISSRIFVLDFVGDAGFMEQQEARRYWWQKIGSPIAARSRIQHRNSFDPDRRIKLGYVSADFRGHSAALCFRPMLLNHDRNQFEVICYSSSRADDVTEEFRQLSDQWRDTTQLSDDELCEQIRADLVDILIDLSGHTAGHRLEVFARKPAPVQVSAGATGTGLPTIDYLFSNPIICPHVVRHLFAEKIVDLPSVMTIDLLPDQLRPSDPPVLSAGYITFGVFNRANKVSGDVVALWARILKAVPRSRIIMKHYAFDDEAMRSQFIDRFAMHGVAPERIVFLGATSRQDHLAAFRDVDISLDPFPHNGGISTLESLQMGVPVVAKLGNSISGRVAGAILHSIGMADWVAESAEEYLAIAVKFASMPDRLKALRYELPGQISSAAVGNSAIYTKAIEAAFRAMWIDYCRTGRQGTFGGLQTA